MCIRDSLIITVTKAVACGNRIQSIFEIPCSMKNGTREIKNTMTSLQFDHVGLTYAEAGTESPVSYTHLVCKL